MLLHDSAAYSFNLCSGSTACCCWLFWLLLVHFVLRKHCMLLLAILAAMQPEQPTMTYKLQCSQLIMLADKSAKKSLHCHSMSTAL